MSTVVDERVVEMRFNNKDFESNVKTSLSTLDKLKQSLNFKDTGKSLEGLGSAVKNVDMNSLSNGANNVKTSFGSLAAEIFKITSMVNIADSAFRMIKNTVSEFTVTPITTGFQEYELKMGSVQTIMASTGESLETVNQYLAELNEYSDKTIYSFSDMTNNIGKFTNAGVKLEDAVKAIKGISNEAAISGANANEASRAMYNFAQALSAGYVKLIDWKSIENANMATVQFKQELINTAVELGTLTKTSDGLYNTGKRNISATREFNDSLQDQWMTTDVLVTTLGKYADETTDIGKKAYAAAQDVKTFSMMMDTLKEAAQSGWAQTWELILGDFEEAKSLFTYLAEFFGNIIDKMSDARNNLLSGVLAPFELLTTNLNNAKVAVEDFEQAVAKALGIPIEGNNKELEEMQTILDGCNKSLEYFGENYYLHLGQSNEHVLTLQKGLAKLGYLSDEAVTGIFDENTYQTVMKYQKEMGIQIDGLAGPQTMGKLIESLKEVKVEANDSAGSFKTISDAFKKDGTDIGEVAKTIEGVLKNLPEDIDKMSDSQVKSTGYTREQLKAFKALGETAEQTNTPIKDLLELMYLKENGRDLLLKSFKFLLTDISDILKYIGEAWRNVFPASSAASLYKIVEGFRNFQKSVRPGVTSLRNLRDTAQGLFSILDLLVRIIATPLKLAFSAITGSVGPASHGLLEITGSIGRAISAFHDFVLQNDLITKGFKALGDGIVWCARQAGQFAQSFFTSERMASIMNSVGNGIMFCAQKVDELVQAFLKIPKVQEILTSFETKLSGFGDIGKNIVAGLKQGLAGGVTALIGEISEMAHALIDKAKEILGIHSPSTVFEEMGENTFLGFINGLKAKAEELYATIREVFNNIAEEIKNPTNPIIKAIEDFIVNVYNTYLKNIDLGNLYAAGLGLGIFYIIKKLFDVITAFAKPAEALGGVLTGVEKTIGTFNAHLGPLMDSFKGIFTSISDTISQVGKDFGKSLKMKAFTGMIKEIAKAVAILTGCVIALAVLQKYDFDLQGAMLILAEIAGLFIVLTGVMVGIAAASKKLEFTSGDIAKIAISFIGIAVAIGILAKVAQGLAQIKWPDLGKSAAFVFGFAVFAAAIAYMAHKTDSEALARIGGIAKNIFKIELVMVAMVGVIKLITLLSDDDLIVGVRFIAGFMTFMVLLTKLSEYLKIDLDQIVKPMLRLGVALALMVGVIKLITLLSDDDLIAGVQFVAGFTSFLIMFVAIANYAGDNLNDLGSMMLKMAGAIAIMAIVVKLLGKMTPGEVIQGELAIAGFAIIVGLLVHIAKHAEKDAPNLGKYLMSVAGSIAIMAIIVKLLGKMTPGEVIQGELAILGFAVIVGLLVHISNHAEKANEVSKLLLGMSSAMLIMSLIVRFLGGLEFTHIAKGELAVLGLVGIIKLLVDITQKASKDAPRISLMLLTMSVAIGVLSGIATLLGFIPLPHLAKGVGAVSMLAAMMALMIWATRGANDIQKSLVIMTIAVGVMSTCAAVLSIIDHKKLMTATVGISLMMAAFGLAIKMVSEYDTSTKSLIAMGIMIAAVAVIATSLYFLADFPWQSLLAGAVGLSLVLVALAGALRIVGDGGANSLWSAGALLIVSVGVIALAFALKQLADVPWENLIAGAAAITIVLLAIAGASYIMEAAAIGALALVAVVLSLGVALLAGGAAVVIFGYGLEIVGAALPSVSEGFRGLGDAIYYFVTTVANSNSSINDFFNVISNIGGAIAVAMLKIAGGLVAIGLAGYVAGPGLVVASVGVIAAAAAIWILCAAVSSGLTMVVEALSGLVEFAQSAGGNVIAGFAKGIIGSANNGILAVKGFLGSIVNTFTGILRMHSPSRLAALWGMFTGQGYANGLTESSGEGESAAKKFLSKVIGVFTSDKTVSETMGDSANEGATSFMDGLENIDMESIMNTITGGVDLEPFKGIMTAGGEDGATNFMDSLTGNLDLSQFTSLMGGAGEDGAQNFSDGLQNGLDLSQFQSLLGGEGLDFSQFESLMGGAGEDGAGAFSTSLTEGFGNISVDTSGIVTSVESSEPQFRAAGEKLAAAVGEGFKNQEGTVKNTMTAIVTSVVTFLGSRQIIFMNCGKLLITRMTSGIKSGANGVKAAVVAIMTTTLSTVKRYTSDFETAGYYISKGLANGIKSGKSEAVNAARNMMVDAIIAAKKEAKINSPAKVMIPVGSAIPEGLALGMDKGTHIAEESSEEMMRTVVDSTKDALGQMTDILDGNVELEPTIRPVLDMGKTKSSELELSANLSAILTSPIDSLATVVSNAQAEINASNQEVVRSINTLRDDLQMLFSGNDQEIALYVDSKKLASSLAKPMNRQLNILSQRGAY